MKGDFHPQKIANIHKKNLNIFELNHGKGRQV